MRDMKKTMCLWIKDIPGKRTSTSRDTKADMSEVQSRSSAGAHVTEGVRQ